MINNNNNDDYAMSKTKTLLRRHSHDNGILCSSLVPQIGYSFGFVVLANYCFCANAYSFTQETLRGYLVRITRALTFEIGF